jgi:hypothetical protein
VKRSILVAVLFLFGSSPVVRADVIISAGYVSDNPQITVFNNTNVALTDVKINATNPAGSKDLGPLAAGATATFSFDNSSSAFEIDPDDDGGRAVSNNTSYSVVVTTAGGTFTTPGFSPNSTGLDFLGLTNDNDFAPVKVAQLAVPEPTTLALFGVVTLSAGYLGLRRRKPAVA